MKILFLGNDASRTGAPIGLRHLLRWLHGQPDVTFALLLRRSGGALQREYEALCQVAGYDTLYSDRGPLRRAARRLGLRRLGGRSCLSPSEEMFAGRGIDVIYANTIATGGMVSDLARLGCPVVCHVHELQSAIDAYGPSNLAHLRRHTTRWIADSHATARNLERNGISAVRVAVAHEFIATAEVPPAGDAAARRHELG
ncbi:MAG: glycosyltransferase, partial [Verrucomicrobia bacterium]|nr:glycosyltransferase [Verrucomicrobiota bacterium]